MTPFSVHRPNSISSHEMKTFTFEVPCRIDELTPELKVEIVNLINQIASVPEHNLEVLRSLRGIRLNGSLIPPCTTNQTTPPVPDGCESKYGFWEWKSLNESDFKKS